MLLVTGELLGLLEGAYELGRTAQVRVCLCAMLGGMAEAAVAWRLLSAQPIFSALSRLQLPLLHFFPRSEQSTSEALQAVFERVRAAGATPDAVQITALQDAVQAGAKAGYATAAARVSCGA